MGWIGVDLDRTLAKYHGWKGELHIGEPIKPMVDQVKLWIEEGQEVRIFTARVSGRSLPNLDGSKRDIDAIVNAIQDWTQKHIGRRLEVTCEKDYACQEIWDDIAVKVVPNKGMPVPYIQVKC